MNHPFLLRIREISGIDQLDERQRRVLALLIGAIVLFLGYQLLVLPYLESRQRLIDSIQRKTEALSQIQRLQQDYLMVKKEVGGIRERLAKRSSRFELFSFVDQCAQQAGVKDAIQYMKPSQVAGEGQLQESSVEIMLKQTSLSDLVAFMELIESEENVVFLRRLSIQENGESQGYLDITLQINTFHEGKGA